MTAFDCRTEPSYNFFHVSHMLLILKTRIIASSYICSFMSSTSKAMASVEVLSSRHIAAILRLSSTRLDSNAYFHLIVNEELLFYYQNDLRIEQPQLEAGDKIIMPPSALDRLASLHIEYPMLFEVHNAAAERTSHCGVLEFIAEEGMIYMPYWMMQNLLLQEGDMVFIKNANLPKGTYVKLQPHTTDFLDISNPKAILEKTLRNFSCLTTGDSIMVAYNNKKYYIDIVETKPSNAISIIETDCEVDFAPPLDYKEPEPVKPAVPASTEPGTDVPAEEEPKFIPFTGSGRRLDGKPSKDKDVLASSPAKRQANATNGVQPSTATTSQGSSSRKATGKLVFGSGGNRAEKAPEKEAEEPKKEDPKFAAFTGKKYSLKG
ncbi:ubiquitin fusion degradation 1 [Zea mays]|uniref:Ubiquitin fusion degradation 1 n=1 Tax=Zea mays TaxID=4577 RepID=A0A1D6QRZ2_MAIZE|nr:ubiquitin fusion degradation 1 [Zea mays]